VDVLKIANRDAATVEQGASLSDVVARMAKDDVGAVTLIDDGRPIGIFTRRDVVRLVDEGTPMDASASGLMSSPVEVLQQGTEVSEALEQMTREHIHHLPVVDANGRIVGVIDTATALKRMVFRLTNELDSLESYFLADGAGG